MPTATEPAAPLDVGGVVRVSSVDADRLRKAAWRNIAGRDGGEQLPHLVNSIFRRPLHPDPAVRRGKVLAGRLLDWPGPIVKQVAEQALDGDEGAARILWESFDAEAVGEDSP